MEAKQTVSAAQFFGMMLVARSTLTLSLSARWAAGEGLPPVSYTHLDVYKRQELGAHYLRMFSF